MTACRVYPLLLIALVAGCSRRPTENPVQAASKAQAPLTVRLAAAEVRHIERSISVTGSLQPDETVSVSSEVAGRVAAIQFDFGQSVRKGDIVAELDRREFLLQLERSRAALSQALARIGLEGGQDDVVPKSTPVIRQAEAQMEDARSKYESASRLVKTGDISQERFTELEKAYRARQAAVEAARDELRTQLANIQALRAEVKLIEKRVGDTTLRAPFDGAVTQKLVSPGQYIKENTPILTVVKTLPLRLRLDIPETASSVVRVGTTLTFTTDAIPQTQFHGVVRELNPSLDARSRSLAAEARLSESDSRLRPGMFVQVRLVVQRDAAIVTVPQAALYTVAGLAKVFTVREGKAVEHRISPGIARDGWVEVPGERISAGDLVAVSNLAALVDGAAVQPEPRG